MQDYLTPIAFVCICIIAVLFGRQVAIWRNRPDSHHLRKGRCPLCKSRKLVPVPMSMSSVMVTCGDCEGQWFIVGADGQQIVTSLGDRCYVPPLVCRWEGNVAVFETKIGYAKFDFDRLPYMPDVMATKTPREALKRLVDGGVKPSELKVVHSGAQLNPWKTFYDSAGIDLPFANQIDRLHREED